MNRFDVEHVDLGHTYEISKSYRRSFVGDKNGGNQKGNDDKKKKKDDSLVTPFGGAAGVLTLTAIISQSSSQIIAFFTEQLNTAILADFSGGEILAVMFIIMFLLLAAIGPIRKLVSTQAGKGYGWRLTLGMFVDFVARISLLMTFGFAAHYLGITWARLGLNLTEKIVTTVSLAFAFFGGYAFYLSQYTSGFL